MIRRLLLFSCMCAVLQNAAAQRQQVQIERPPQVEDTMDSATSARYQLALGYLRGAQFDRAIALLEELYAENRGIEIFFQKLKEAYENVKKYDDAIYLIEERLTSSLQASPELRTDRARLLFLSGKESFASAAWEEVLAQANGNESIYRLVYNSLLEVRLLDRAIDVLIRGRAESNRPELFQPELAALYSVTGQHEEAMTEYLDLLIINSRQINFVRGRLSRALEQEGALDATLKITSEHVADNPLDRTARDLLQWLFMEAGDFAEAFSHVVVLDSIDGGDGVAVYQFAIRAAEGGAYNAAQEAFDAVLASHPEGQLVSDARLGLANMHRLQAESAHENSHSPSGAPHYNAALQAYEAFLDQYPDHARQSEVMTHIGALHQDVFHNAGAAHSILSEVVLQYPGTAAAHEARFNLGRLALAQGELEKSRIIFEQLANQLTFGELAARAQFEQALIHFYRGELDEVRQILEQLNEDTSREIANDAIALRVLVLENPGMDSTNAALRAYASAALLYRQHKVEETVSVITDLLAHWGQHPVADEARYLRAQALRKAHRTHEALAAFGELPLIHPDSPLCDRSLFTYAEILERELGDISAALDAYTNLLTKHPGSLLVSAARARIRTLREAGA